MAANEGSISREEKIAKMQADGILTAEQARKLLEGLTTLSNSTQAAATAQRASQPWAIYISLVVITALIVWLLGSGGGDGTIQDVSETINQTGGTGEMNNSFSNILAALLILAVPVALFAWIYNSMVSREEAVFSSWAQVESSYQRRSDLIPNLVDTVSRYMNFEADTLGQITAARSQATGNIDELVQELIDAQQASAELLNTGDDLLNNDAALAALQQAQAQVGGRMMRLFAVVEDYPELRSSDQFLELQGQLEGTENRINVARLRFNEAVENFNESIRKLPGSLVAGIGNFQRKAYFQADAGSDNAPTLNFN